MTAHTPGPWEWDSAVWDYDPSNDAPWLISGTGEQILSGEIECPSEANARLIAAAPELLEALQALDNYVCNNISSDYPIGIDTDSPAFRKASAAIAKATGEPA